MEKEKTSNEENKKEVTETSQKTQNVSKWNSFIDKHEKNISVLAKIATIAVFVWAFVSGIVTSCNAGKSLKIAKESIETSNKNAANSLDAAKLNLELQSRPFLAVHEELTNWELISRSPEHTEYQLVINFGVENFGKTPAQQIKVEDRILRIDIPDKLFEDYITPIKSSDDGAREKGKEDYFMYKKKLIEAVAECLRDNPFLNETGIENKTVNNYPDLFELSPDSPLGALFFANKTPSPLIAKIDAYPDRSEWTFKGPWLLNPNKTERRRLGRRTGSELKGVVEGQGMLVVSLRFSYHGILKEDKDKSKYKEYMYQVIGVFDANKIQKTEEEYSLAGEYPLSFWGQWTE